MLQLFIDSRDRVSGTSCNFTIQLPQTLVLDGSHRGRIDNLRIPLVIPTIQTGVNDTITVKLGNQSYTVTIPQANYDGPGLAGIIQSVLASAAPGAWTVSYNTATIEMSIQCSNAFTITGGTYGAYLLSRVSTNTSNKYVFSCVFVMGIDVFYLSSPNFATLDTLGPQGASDTLMQAVVTLPFGSVLDESMPYNSWFEINPMTTQQLSFALRDRSYNILNSIANISFVMTID